MNSRKKRIVVYIAAAVVILIISSALVLKKTNNKEILLDKLELGQQYLVELDYSSAVLEFTDAIKIEPKSEDAYVGLADAYSGMGETDKAIEALEEGYVKTGNENFLDMIESFKQSAEAQTAAVETTAVQTTTAPPETTTMQTTTVPPETTTVQTTTVPSETTTVQTITTLPETTAANEKHFYAEDALGMTVKEVSEIFGKGEVCFCTGGWGVYYENEGFEIKICDKYIDWEKYDHVFIDDNAVVGMVFIWSEKIPANRDLSVGMPIISAAEICGMTADDIYTLDIDWGYHLTCENKYPYHVGISTNKESDYNEPVTEIVLTAPYYSE